MGKYNAVSDLDYVLDFRPKTVTRTCVKCTARFQMEMEGSYVLQPWCESCLAREDDDPQGVVKGMINATVLQAIVALVVYAVYVVVSR